MTQKSSFVSDKVIGAIEAALVQVGADPSGVDEFVYKLVEQGYEVRRIRAAHRKRSHDVSQPARQ